MMARKLNPEVLPNPITGALQLTSHGIDTILSDLRFVFVPVPATGPNERMWKLAIGDFTAYLYLLKGGEGRYEMVTQVRGETRSYRVFESFLLPDNVADGTRRRLPYTYGSQLVDALHGRGKQNER